MAGKKNKAKKGGKGGDDFSLVTPPNSDDAIIGSKSKNIIKNKNVEMEDEGEEELKVYLPGMELAEDEQLEVDPSAYVMLHELNAEWPCLSFDPVRDGDGEERTGFPMSAYFVTGSQADSREKNMLYFLRCANLHKTQQKDPEEEDEDEDNESSEDEEEGDEGSEDRGPKKPHYYCVALPHDGGVNRIRSQNIVEGGILRKVMAATWSDTGVVQVWDVQSVFTNLHSIPTDTSPSSYTVKKDIRPVHVNGHHRSEGYGLAWSSVAVGSLLVGDCSGLLSLTKVYNDRVETEKELFKGHSGSVEDIEWSPSEATVFASSSTDGTVRLWDIRMPRHQSALSATVSPTDVNVISWNQHNNHILATGSDDGVFATWDLRQWSTTNDSTSSTLPPLSAFNWHKQSITSIEWNPHDPSVLAVAGADDQISIWDFAVVTSEDEAQKSEAMMIDGREVPSQLLFIHQGQKEIKEIHWHPQISGVLMSTALSGFNIFKTISV